MRLCVVLACVALFSNVPIDLVFAEPESGAKPMDAKPAVGDAFRPDFKPLLNTIQTLVEKHFPKAKITQTEHRIHFEFDTRQFKLHDSIDHSEWQEAKEEPGPNAGGIHGDIQVCAGKYVGSAILPQTIDRWYFKLLLMAPHSKKLNRHLYVQLKHPGEVPIRFLKEFESLIADFENHVSAPAAQAELPTADEDHRPKISAKEAIRLAEKYVDEKKLDVSKHYIRLVSYQPYTTEPPYWKVYFCFIVARKDPAGEIWVDVQMDGSCSHYVPR